LRYPYSALLPAACLVGPPGRRTETAEPPRVPWKLWGGVWLVEPPATVGQIAERVGSGGELHGHRAGAVGAAAQRMCRRVSVVPVIDHGHRSHFVGQNECDGGRVALEHIHIVAIGQPTSADPRVKGSRPKVTPGLHGVAELAGRTFGLVADDVDHMRGELVKPRVTINCHVPSARRGLVLVAAAIAALAEGEAGLSDNGGGR
jgi:hypothetical protein